MLAKLTAFSMVLFLVTPAIIGQQRETELVSVKVVQPPAIDGKGAPRPQAKKYETPRGAIYIDRPEDSGRSTTMSQPKPADFIATSVFQYSAQLATESAADIRAKGEWAKGRWTVEMERRLNTGHSDDVRFDLSEGYPMAVAVHDSEEYQNHSVSGVVRLRFAKP